jgi:two-component system response regulator HydG
MRKRKPVDLTALKVEYDNYIQALIQADFNRTRAAKILNIDRRTLYNKFIKFKEAGLHSTHEPV